LPWLKVTKKIAFIEILLVGMLAKMFIFHLTRIVHKILCHVG